MARIRSIKPDFFNDETTAVLHPDAQLLLLGLATLADREGLLEDRPRRIKAILFPYRDVDVEAHLEALVGAGVVKRYTAAGQACIFLTTFSRDQKPHPKETSYGLPGPERAEPVQSTASREVSRQEPDESRRVPMVVGVVVGDGCGSGSGSGSSLPVADAPPEDLPDATEHETEVNDGQQESPEKAPGSPAIARNDAPSTRIAPPLSLVAQEAGKKPRKPSKAEALYAKLEEARRERCDEVGAVFVALEWAPARINAQLGSLARVQGEEAERMSEAFALFLEDERGAAWNPPWDLGMFLVRRAEYVSRALRAAGGMP